MARPDAPPDLGLALSQARAVRVRAQLLELLATEAHEGFLPFLGQVPQLGAFL